MLVNVYSDTHKAEANFRINVHELLLLADRLHHLHLSFAICVAVMFMNMLLQCLFVPDIGLGKEHARPEGL